MSAVASGQHMGIGAPSTRSPAGARIAPDVRVAAQLLLGVGGVVIWWPTLHATALWALPLVAITTMVLRGKLPASGWPALYAAAPALLWGPIVALLTGVGPSAFHGQGFIDGVRMLAEQPGAAPSTPAALPLWLLGCGGFWYFGAFIAVQPGRASGATAFFLTAAPFAAAIAAQGHAGGAAWHGCVVLVSALLWATRGGVRRTLPALTGVAVFALVVAGVAGPNSRWKSLDKRSSQSSTYNGKGPQPIDGGSVFNSDQNYGPINGSGITGQEMFQVTAKRPALWRMQVLDYYDGSRWTAGSGPGDELPQPGAQGVLTTVHVAALRDRRAVAPGRIITATGAGTTTRGAGESVSLGDLPGTGGAYEVSSQDVAPTIDQLANIQIPVGSQYAKYTEAFRDQADLPTPVTSIANRMTPAFAATEMGQTILTARDLANANSELGVVENVVSYLKTSGTFSYSLDVAPPGQTPILDFLTRTHVGYCQHFAGAAALLLRLAGVPTRVATGFATGVPTGGNTYDVRDADGHAWIEVYFPGYGWVPFNPTTSAAAASIPAGVNLLSNGASGTNTLAAKSAGKGTISIVGLGLLLAVAAAGSLWWLRGRAGLPVPPMGDVLVRLVPPSTGDAMTHGELHAQLSKVGPNIAALAQAAGEQRFGPGEQRPEAHPSRRVWVALRRDVGFFRAVRLMTIGPPTVHLDRGAGDPVTTDLGAPISSPVSTAMVPAAARSVPPPLG